MSKDNILALPANTRIMHDSQEKWRGETWKETLDKHNDEIEKLLGKINLFDIWSDTLQNYEGAKILIPEIFMDGYVSIHFAGYGLYKYANVCLRSQLENTLRLIYFSRHPVEFDWWRRENEWYRSGLKAKDVWGEGYKYFEELENIKKFEKNCEEEKRLFQKGKRINKIYQKLSKYVHSGVLSFQTNPNEFSPRYNIEDFKNWDDRFKEVQEYINILLILGFLKEFKEMGRASQEKVKKVGIELLHYKEKLKEVLDADC